MSSIAINFYPQRLDPPRKGEYIFQTADLQTIALKNGLNVIKESELSIIENHPSYQGLIALGALVVSKTIDSQKQVLPPSIKDVKKVGDIKTLIASCHEIPVLRQWHEEEQTGAGRPTILSAINDRIEALESRNIITASIVQ